MNSPGGAATQICSPQFDRRFFDLPPEVQTRIQNRLDDLGQKLQNLPHHRMQGVDAFRLRVGDFRIIYPFNLAKNELHLITLGNRRDVYKTLLN
jgi:mRNA-degrading endonuclease RelE of RelBE toxin-antitoxin system